MNLPAIFSGSFLVALSGAAAPGPLLAITVERTLKKGFMAGPLLITGHVLLEAGVVVLIIHGIRVVVCRARGRRLFPRRFKLILPAVFSGVFPQFSLEKAMKAEQGEFSPEGVLLPFFGFSICLRHIYTEITYRQDNLIFDRTC